MNVNASMSSKDSGEHLKKTGVRASFLGLKSTR